MGTVITVAPREIHDLAYRAGRVAGCDPGTAERIAENVTFTEIHHGAAVSTFCEALRTVDLPTSVWTTAPDALHAAEVATRADGDASATFETGVPLAAIAGTLWQCLARGVAATGIDGHARGDTTVRVVGLRSVGAGDGSVATRRAGIAEARLNAHRLGVGVDGIWFNRLEEAASEFLVAEATLDLLD